jgi:hypothetical protein
VGEATAKQLAATHESLEALADSEVLRDIRDLGAKESERAEISPRSRKNPPKNEAEKAKREQRDAELKAEIAEIESRLETGRLESEAGGSRPGGGGERAGLFRVARREESSRPHPRIGNQTGSEKPPLPRRRRPECSALFLPARRLC